MILGYEGRPEDFGCANKTDGNSFFAVLSLYKPSKWSLLNAFRKIDVYRAIVRFGTKSSNWRMRQKSGYGRAAARFDK